MYEELTNKDQTFSVCPDNQWDSDLPIFSTRTQLSNTGCTVDHVLQLLRQLHNLSINPMISLLKPYTDDFFEGNLFCIRIKSIWCVLLIIQCQVTELHRLMFIIRVNERKL